MSTLPPEVSAVLLALANLHTLSMVHTYSYFLTGTELSRKTRNIINPRLCAVTLYTCMCDHVCVCVCVCVHVCVCV